MKEELKKVFDKANECIDDAKFLFEDARYEAAVNQVAVQPPDRL